jgi:O-acetylserine/cysteine efflux transporter
VVIATVLGYGIWNTLLARYPSSSVAPFSMLVPIVGVLSSWAMFSERIDGVEALAGIAVVGGVLIGSLPLRLPVLRLPRRGPR